MTMSSPRSIVSGAESPFTFCSGFVLADWRVKHRDEQDNGGTFFKMPLILAHWQFPKQNGFGQIKLARLEKCFKTKRIA